MNIDKSGFQKDGRLDPIVKAGAMIDTLEINN